MLDLDFLEAELLEALQRHARRFGLRGELRAEYVPNPGNFETANFTVTSATAKLHVKLSPDASGLDRWFELRATLSDRYRAPTILGRLDVGGLHGLVFPHLPGRVPSDDLLPEITRLSRRINADRELAARIDDGEVPTYRSCYRTGIFECLSEDLVAVKADPDVRRLLSAADLRFAEGEVERLRHLGTERIPDEPATSPIHGDLWLQNVLATDDDWYLLDWDSLRIGDPAGEYASLLHEPTGRGVDASSLLPQDDDLRDRFDLLLRAYCFDEIVDPLSDLTLIPTGIADRDRIWRERARRSQVALIRYRRTYDTRPVF